MFERGRQIYGSDGWTGLFVSGLARILRSAGVPVRRSGTEITINRRNKFADLRQHIDTEAPTIVDGGAAVDAGEDHIGAYLESFSHPEIHAFEPRPTAAQSVNREYGHLETVTVHDVAIGPTESMIEINVSEEGGSSSPFKPKDLEQRGRRTTIQNTIKVQQVRLDDILTDGADIIKLDVEGYEKEVLKGATNALSDAKAVLCEVQFYPYYEGAVSFIEITEFLRERGFQLYNIYDEAEWVSGQLVHADALFLQEDKE